MALSPPFLKTLVTGGAGFIGSNLAVQLLRSGHDVVILDNLLSGHRINLRDVDCQFVEGDIYPTHIARLFPDGDKVEFLLIAKSKVRDGGPDDFFIMKDKVTIRLYRRFAAEHPQLTKADLGGADDRDRGFDRFRV